MNKAGTRKEHLYYFLWPGLLLHLYYYVLHFYLIILNMIVKVQILRFMREAQIKNVNNIYAKIKNSLDKREEFILVSRKMISMSLFLITQIFIVKKKLFLLLFQVSRILDLFWVSLFSQQSLIIKEECLLTLLPGSQQHWVQL